MDRSLLRVLLIDDHRLFRSGLQLILEKAAGLAVVGEAGDAATAIELAKTGKPDVIVADIHLPDGDGIEMAVRIKALCPAVRVVFLSSDADFALVRRALDAGGNGYLIKDSAPQELIRAIEAAMKGTVYLSPEVAAALVQDYRQRNDEAAPAPRVLLSKREKEVLRHIAEGFRNKEIADRLGVSVKSVETYRRRLLEKLGYTSTAELVRHAVREGIISA
jgi:DNA-binding NarL/FixJ family response regulator